MAVAAARDERHAERARIKLEEQEPSAEIQVAADAAVKAEDAAREKVQQDSVARDAENKAAQKAERDRRYADRRARQR